jgi:pimeloyl-ACP methyl ester carboxylesterase
MRWLRRGLALLVGLFAVLAFGVLPYWLAGRLVAGSYHYNDKENAGLTPGSFHLPFQDVSFKAGDGVNLRGWWVPAAQDRGSVVLVHGFNRSRIEMVKKTPFLNGLGWNALLFDLRHHGDSGGQISSLGFFEKEDVKAAIAEARARSRGPVIVWGVSLGAASAVLAAAEDPAVVGVVADSSFRSLRDTVVHHAGLFRTFRWWTRLVPVWPTASEIVFWIGRRGGFDPDAVDVKSAAARLAGRPVLFVCNSGDRRMPQDVAFDLKDAVGPTASVLVVPGTTHGGAWREGTAAYETAVTWVLQEALAPRTALAAAR